MKSSFRGPFLFILGVTFSGFLFSLHYTKSREPQESTNINVASIPSKMRPPENLIVRTSRISSESQPPPPQPSPISSEDSREIDENEENELSETPEALEETKKTIEVKTEVVNNCECTSESTGKKYDFCYVDPQNSKSVGKKFDCAHLKILEKLHLVDNPGPFVNLSDPITNQNEMVFVSALSDNHFNEGTMSLEHLRKHQPNAKFIVYGLNLNPMYAKHYDVFKNVEFRPFNTTGYPEYVNQWMTYRFKPLIIAEVMKEYRNIWWMDAHISVKKPNMSQLLTWEVAEKRKDEKNMTLPSPILFFIHSSHSNFAVMFPELLGYFPSNSIALLKNEQHGSQLGANTFYVARTELTIEIFKWWILCALDEKCMNPPGAQVYCSFKENRFDYFANCYRFDQSVLNLLLLNHFQDHHKYYSQLGHLF